MPYVHNIRRRIQGRLASSRFWVDKRPAPRGRIAGALGIPRYHQLDVHSCGFLAALAVVRHFAPETEADEVLRVVAPSSADGCDQRHLIRYLKQVGVTAVYREGLGRRRLLKLAAAGTPVIVTVQPDWYECDHWTVVRGLNRTGRRVFLSNYGWLAKDGSLPWEEFLEIWYPRGGGLVCK